jgi:hypothetical protein
MRSGLILLLLAVPALAGEIVRLTPETWRHVPGGKEVDAIFGDWLLKNDRVVAVVGDAVPGRHAHLSAKNVQGAVIDFALLSTSNDQLTAFKPHGDWAEIRPAAEKIEVVRADGPEVVLRATKPATEKDPVESVTEYSLRDGESFLRVTTRHRNGSDRAAKVRLSDKIRCDQTFAQTPAGAVALAAFYDKWFGAAYGVLRPEGQVSTDGKFNGMFGANSGTWLDYPELVEDAERRQIELAPGREVTLTRFLLAGRHAADLRVAAAGIRGGPAGRLSLTVTGDGGEPVPGADVLVLREGREADAAHTDREGKAQFALANGRYVLNVSQPGRAPRVAAAEVAEGAASAVGVKLGPRSQVTLEVTDGEGRPSPCKVQFLGVETTPHPDLGPRQRHNGCGNLFFSADGRGEVPLPAGRYYAIVSRGPEVDAVYRFVNLGEGKSVKLSARLVRTVNSAGWVSADFHNHSTESGDNTTSAESRIVCLAAEGVEFAASTEHNRIQTYRGRLKALGLEKVLATSDGIELTGSPLPLNHHNAFPLRHHPNRQDGGGPLVALDPLAQIKRLHEHDHGSEKLVQQNHPDLGWLVYDRNGDGVPDAGFGTLPFTHAIEIWRPNILDLKPTEPIGPVLRNNRVFNWLQLLNQGVRLPGVANTDAHYCIHESGRIRNYVRCSTDDPAKIDEMEMVREAKKGHLVMTNGPFLDVSLEGALPGDDVRLQGPGALKVRVECPNWLDVDRVQVLVNGRPDPNLNFTRESHPSLFGDGTVKFKADLRASFLRDSHVIVVAIGERSTTGPVMGQSSEPPVAIANPIFVDADGNGFAPNKDTLGAPLPVRKDPDNR